MTKSHRNKNFRQNLDFVEVRLRSKITKMRCVHSLVKNLQVFFIKVKFFASNILTTKCKSVRERVKNALSCTLLYLIFKIYKKKKKNAHIYKKNFNEFFFTNECTHLKKKNYCKVLKLQRYSSNTLNLSPKKNNSEGPRSWIPKKSKFCLIIVFLSDLVIKLLNLFVFKRISLKIS